MLDKLREQIDATDIEITKLFAKRMKLCKDVADYKKENNLPVMQGNREQDVLDNVMTEVGEELADGVKALFTNIMDISKCLQQREILSGTEPKYFPVFSPDDSHIIACQGLAGANSEEAARNIFRSNKINYYKNFEDVFAAVESGEVDYGILAIDNTITGSVGLTYELLGLRNCYVTAMTEVKIEHCLCVKKGFENEPIKFVYSHPQALTQCSEYLKKQGLKCVEWSNTADAASFVSKSNGDIAAICSKSAAEEYSLKIIDTDIANYPCNYTRFVCIARNLQVAAKPATVSIVIVLPHYPGSLYRLMTKFFVNNVNITKLESRPLADGSFNFKFYFDFDGDIRDPKTVALLKEIEAQVEYYKFLGCF